MGGVIVLEKRFAAAFSPQESAFVWVTLLEARKNIFHDLEMAKSEEGGSTIQISWSLLGAGALRL